MLDMDEKDIESRPSYEWKVGEEFYDSVRVLCTYVLLNCDVTEMTKEQYDALDFLDHWIGHA